MIPQLISELSENGETKAAKELAIAYLKHERNPEILNLLGKLYHDDKQFDKALECLDVLQESPGIITNKAKCLYYLRRAPEAEKILLKLPKEVREDPLVQIDRSLYTTAQGKFDLSKRILEPIADSIPQAEYGDMSGCSKKSMVLMKLNAGMAKLQIPLHTILRVVWVMR